MANVKIVHLTDEQANFLEENYISFTKFVRRKIDEEMEKFKEK